MHLKTHPYDPIWLKSLRNGGPDDNGQPAESATSDGQGNPCRSCLCEIPAGEAMLIAAACPFPDPQPYAETGPVFFCADDCTAWASIGLPPILMNSTDYLVKGYTADHRILYGTGRITPKVEMEAYLRQVLLRDGVAFADVRSARNNCFQARVTLTKVVA